MIDPRSKIEGHISKGQTLAKLPKVGFHPSETQKPEQTEAMESTFPPSKWRWEVGLGYFPGSEPLPSMNNQVNPREF